MDQRIHQEECNESRPNFSCEDGTVFIYSRDGGIYEPYERSKEDRNAQQKDTHKQMGGGFTKFLRKYWKFIVTSLISFLTLAVVSIYTFLAWKANQITRESLTSVQRAFVNSTTVVSAFPVNPIDKASKEALFMNFAVPFVNNGSTPTIDMVFYCHGEVRSSAPTAGDFKDFDPAHQYKVDLAPKTRTFCYIDRLISRSDIKKTKLGGGGSEDLYLWGWSTYRDVFKCRHRIKFLYVMSGVSGNPLIPDKGNFTWFTKDIHNCVDEECDAEK